MLAMIVLVALPARAADAGDAAWPTVSGDEVGGAGGDDTKVSRDESDDDGDWRDVGGDGAMEDEK
jgi:hypothetical protein